MKTRTRINRRFVIFEASLLMFVLLLSGVGTRLRADSGTCGGQTVNLPFIDVAGNAFFCQIAAAFFSGLTNGTTATTYSPTNTVTREQMAAFITRTLDQSLRRRSLRAAFGQWWTPQSENQLGATTLGGTLHGCATDGISVYACNATTGDLHQVSITSGTVTTVALSTANDVVLARGKAYVINENGMLSEVDFSTSPATVTTIASSLGTLCSSIAFDGDRFFVTSDGDDKVVGVRINAGGPPTITDFPGFNRPFDVLFDGSNLWVTNSNEGAVKLLNRTTGAITSFALPNNPGGARPLVFDGTNLWVATVNGKLYVLRTNGTVIAELSGNGLSAPRGMAFDGERVLVASNTASSPKLSVWQATSLSPIATLPMTNATFGVCSDGVNFFVGENGGPGRLFRY